MIAKLAALTSVALLSSAFQDCRDRDNHGAGLVPDASAPVAAADAGVPQVADVMQCAGCQPATVVAWTFEGIYRDATCTDPIAQAVTPVCASVPALGPTNVTYVDPVGGRKAGESAPVTLKEAIGPEAPRYRKAGTACVKANEAAVAVTPTTCAGSRVCRDANGALACTGCRTFANGCPDFLETRTYASIEDTVAFGAKHTGGANKLAALRQCCTALANEGKRLGSSPEGGLLLGAAAQCTALVAAAGPSGNAPELGALKTLLAGRSIPAVCAGL